MKKIMALAVIMILTTSQSFCVQKHCDIFKLQDVLKGSIWEWGGSKEKIEFKNNGYIGNSKWERRGLATSWKVIDEHTVILIVTKGRRMDRYAVLIFNDDFSNYSGYDFHKNGKLKTSKRVDAAEVKEKKKVTVDNKTKARERMRKDLKIYSREELREIETLYQVANKKWRSQEGVESLKLLIENYKKANRTGCALLYLGQMSRGDEQIKYLMQAIKDFSDCYYGNGVQVGAYARFKLLWIYVRNGNKTKADKLVQEIKTNYPDAIDHRGNNLVDIIDREFKKK